MATKPGRWCARCRAVHGGACPNAPVWQKPVGKKSGRGGRPWERTRKRIFERDNFLCQIHLAKNELVAVDLHGSNAGVCDHILALEHGGTNSDSNLQTICKACDKEKTHAESMMRRGGSNLS